jgi:hypothetical protein
LGLHSQTLPRTSANMKITLFFVLPKLLVVAAAPTPQGVGESLVRMRESHGPTLAIDAQEGMTLFGTVSGMANASFNLDQPAMLPIATGDWNIRVHGVFGCFGVSQPPCIFCWGLVFLCSASLLPSPVSLLSLRSLLLPRLILKSWLRSDRSPLGELFTGRLY